MISLELSDKFGVWCLKEERVSNVWVSVSGVSIQYSEILKHRIEANQKWWNAV